MAATINPLLRRKGALRDEKKGNEFFVALFAVKPTRCGKRNSFFPAGVIPASRSALLHKVAIPSQGRHWIVGKALFFDTGSMRSSGACTVFCGVSPTYPASVRSSFRFHSLHNVRSRRGAGRCDHTASIYLRFPLLHALRSQRQRKRYLRVREGQTRGIPRGFPHPLLQLRVRGKAPSGGL